MYRGGWGRQRAYVLAFILLCVVLIVVLGSTVVALCAHLLELSRSDLSSERARYAAESGLVYALEAVQATPTLNGLQPQTAMPQRPQCWYRVRVWNNITGTANIAAADGTAVTPGSLYLQSVGSDGHLDRTICALYQCAPITGFGIKTLGVASGAAVKGASAGGASVGTNSSKSSALVIDGTVSGYAYTGPGGSKGTSGPKSHMKGFKSLASPVTTTVPMSPLPAVSNPDETFVSTNATLPPGSYHALTVTSANLQLQPGIYFFSSNVDIGGASTITINPPGAVDIYVDGSWTVGGTSSINSGGTNAFYLFGTANSTGMTFKNNSVSYLNGYAPTDAMIVQDNAEVIGSLFGQSLAINNNGVLQSGTNGLTSVQEFIKI